MDKICCKSEHLNDAGFDIHDKEDWIDLGVATGTGFVGGALMTIPGGATVHLVEVGIMTNLVEDQDQKDIGVK